MGSYICSRIRACIFITNKAGHLRIIYFPISGSWREYRPRWIPLPSTLWGVGLCCVRRKNRGIIDLIKFLWSFFCGDDVKFLGFKLGKKQRILLLALTNPNNPNIYLHNTLPFIILYVSHTCSTPDNPQKYKDNMPKPHNQVCLFVPHHKNTRWKDLGVGQYK